MIVIGYILSCIGTFTLGGWAARGWYAIADRLDARRKRLAAERATWAESVTKQTKPPPIVEANTEKFVSVFTGRSHVVADGVTAYELTPEARHALSTGGAQIPSPIAQDSTLPSPTAPASARRVRRVTKRRK